MISILNQKYGNNNLNNKTASILREHKADWLYLDKDSASMCQ